MDDFLHEPISGQFGMRRVGASLAVPLFVPLAFDDEQLSDEVRMQGGDASQGVSLVIFRLKNGNWKDSSQFRLAILKACEFAFQNCL